MLLAGALPAGGDRTYADSVLRPRFAAAFNEWSLKHPTERLVLDVKDLERWRAATSAWREMERAYREAGYR